MTVSHLLVVDDELFVRTFLRDLLEENGFKVTTASNGKEALQVLDKLTPDLILSDVDMQEMSGPELLRQLNEGNVTIPVVFMSGHSNDRLATFGIDVANTTLVRKPFSPTSLVNLLKNILGSSLQSRTQPDGKS